MPVLTGSPVVGHVIEIEPTGPPCWARRLSPRGPSPRNVKRGTSRNRRTTEHRRSTRAWARGARPDSRRRPGAGVVSGRPGAARDWSAVGTGGRIRLPWGTMPIRECGIGRGEPTMALTPVAQLRQTDGVGGRTGRHRQAGVGGRRGCDLRLSSSDPSDVSRAWHRKTRMFDEVEGSGLCLDDRGSVASGERGFSSSGDG